MIITILKTKNNLLSIAKLRQNPLLRLDQDKINHQTLPNSTFSMLQELVDGGRIKAY